MFIFSYLEYYPSTNISHNQERTEKVEKGWGRGVETQGVWQMEKYFFVFEFYSNDPFRIDSKLIQFSTMNTHSQGRTEKFKRGGG